MPVAELLERMSSAELTEWAALFELRGDEARLADATQKAAVQARRMARG